MTDDPSELPAVRRIAEQLANSDAVREVLREQNRRSAEVAAQIAKSIAPTLEVNTYLSSVVADIAKRNAASIDEMTRWAADFSRRYASQLTTIRSAGPGPTHYARSTVDSVTVTDSASAVVTRAVGVEPSATTPASSSEPDDASLIERAQARVQTALDDLQFPARMALQVAAVALFILGVVRPDLLTLIAEDATEATAVVVFAWFVLRGPQ